jgi:hypothetical protein
MAQMTDTNKHTEEQHSHRGRAVNAQMFGILL